MNKHTALTAECGLIDYLYNTMFYKNDNSYSQRIPFLFLYFILEFNYVIFNYNKYHRYCYKLLVEFCFLFQQ